MAEQKAATLEADLREHLGIADLNEFSAAQLERLAGEFGLEIEAGGTSKGELIYRLLSSQARREGYLFASGVFELSNAGPFGFLRRRDAAFDQTDVYVSAAQVVSLGLRPGDVVAASVRVPMEEERYYSLVRIEAINGIDPEIARRRTS